jgi:hypothetical protein
VIPRLFGGYVTPAPHERTLSSEEIKSALTVVGITTCSLENFNIDPHFELPKLLSIFQTTILNKLLRRMPASINKYFSYQLIICGKR